MILFLRYRRMAWIFRSISWMRISVFWGSLSLVAESPDFFQTRDLSLQREVSHIIDRGNGWLLTQQRENGSWDGPDPLVATGMAMLALGVDPEERHAGQKALPLRRGIDYLLTCLQPDGGMYLNASMAMNQTSISLLVLASLPHEKSEKAVPAARSFLLQQLAVSPAAQWSHQTLKSPAKDAPLANQKPNLVLLGQQLRALQACYFSGQSHAFDVETSIHFTKVRDQLLRESASLNPMDSAWKDLCHGLMLQHMKGRDASHPEVNALLTALNALSWVQRRPEDSFSAWLERVHWVVPPLVWMGLEPRCVSLPGDEPWRHYLAFKLMNAQDPAGSWGASGRPVDAASAIEDTSRAILVLSGLYADL